MSERIGVVIVAYNSAGVIGRCLDSCRSMNTVVVDNASSDSTREEVASRRDVAIIANGTNRGFAAAVNQGVRRLNTEFILLLNPDVELHTTVEGLATACDQTGAGLAAGLLTDSAGRPQAGFSVRRLPTAWALVFEVLGINRLLPWNPVNQRYRGFDIDLTQPGFVEQPAGAFLLFRRNVWEQLGGFDEQFHPIWFEDVDFCRRAISGGQRIAFVPQVTAAHEGAHSVRALDWSCRQVYWYASLLKYVSRHFPKSALRGVSVAVMSSAVVKGAVGLAATRSLRPWAVYARIFQFATFCLWFGRVPGPAVQSSEKSSAVGKVNKADFTR